MYEVDKFKGKHKTIYLNNYGGMQKIPTVKRVEMFHNRTALPN